MARKTKSEIEALAAIEKLAKLSLKFNAMRLEAINLLRDIPDNCALELQIKNVDKSFLRKAYAWPGDLIPSKWATLHSRLVKLQK